MEATSVQGAVVTCGGGPQMQAHSILLLQDALPQSPANTHLSHTFRITIAPPTCATQLAGLQTRRLVASVCPSQREAHGSPERLGKLSKFAQLFSQKSEPHSGLKDFKPLANVPQT